MLKIIVRSTIVSLIISFFWFGTATAAPLAQPQIVALFSFPGTRPINLGLNHDRFANCPPTPNCVNSFSRDSDHAIAPLPYESDQAFAALKQTIAALPRTRIVQASDNYLYAEFTSKIMGFVDDVEFYLDKPAGVIQVRSASRLGESDLGVNRQRIELIRTKLKDAAV